MATNFSLVWVLVLGGAGLALLLASVVVLIGTRRQGITAGQIWLKGTAIYRDLQAFVTPRGARTSAGLAVAGCGCVLAAIALVLARV